MKLVFRCLLRSAAFVAIVTSMAAPVWADNIVEMPRVNNADGSEITAQYDLKMMGKYKLNFKSIGDRLGKDGADQTDTLTFDIPGGGVVRVETKIGTTSKYTYLAQVGDSSLDGQGFELTLVSHTDSQITVSIRSDSNVSALSHIVFSLPDMAATYD